MSKMMNRKWNGWGCAVVAVLALEFFVSPASANSVVLQFTVTGGGTWLETSGTMSTGGGTAFTLDYSIGGGPSGSLPVGGANYYVRTAWEQFNFAPPGTSSSYVDTWIYYDWTQGSGSPQYYLLAQVCKATSTDLFGEADGNCPNNFQTGSSIAGGMRGANWFAKASNYDLPGGAAACDNTVQSPPSPTPVAQATAQYEYGRPYTNDAQDAFAELWHGLIRHGTITVAGTTCMTGPTTYNAARTVTITWNDGATGATGLIYELLARSQAQFRVVDSDGQASADDCNAATPAYISIQAAVNDANPGDTIKICPGIYTEQVVISKSNLHLIGSGAGDNPAADTIIKSPVGPLPYSFSTGLNNYPVIGVHDATGVSVEKLRVDGDGRGNLNYRFMGIAFWNAGGQVEDCCVTRIEDTPFSGAQHGVAIYAYNNTGGPYTIGVTKTTVTDYQKNAMALSGTGLTVNVSDCNVIGKGPTATTAQNGIQIGFGAGGSIANCKVARHIYTGGSWGSAGILLYQGNTTNATGCDLLDNQTGAYYQDTNGTFSNSVIVNVIAGADCGLIASNSSAKAMGRALKPSPLEEEAAARGKNLGDMAVTISGSTLTGRGATDSIGIYGYSDGAVLATTVTDCVVHRWDYGMIAEEAGGALSLTANQNAIFGNTSYGLWSNTASVLNATDNWWGDATGPHDPSGSEEAASPTCYDPATMVNADGLGDGVSDLNVNYCPWLTSYARVELAASAVCFHAPAPNYITINVWAHDLTDVIQGGQFFLEYDNTVLDFVSAAPAPTVFTFEVYQAVDEAAGTIDYAAGVPLGFPNTTLYPDHVMAVVTFQLMPAHGELCHVEDLVWFRPHYPPTRLTTTTSPLLVPAVTLGAITADNIAPVVTAPDAVDLECSTTLPAAATTIAEFLALTGASATDNCTAQASLIVAHSDATPQGNECDGTITRTYTITDACGNSTDVDQIFTVTDDTAPVATAPTSVDLECSTTLPAAATTIADFLALPGASATDNCTAQADLIVTNSDGTLQGGECNGTITRTYTITDACGNSTDVGQIFTLTDDTAPVATAPTTVGLECSTALPAAATTIADFLALPGASASDNCTAQAGLVVTHSDGTLQGGECDGTLTRTYTVTDACGNATQVEQVFTVTDDTAPVATAPITVDLECSTALPAAATTIAGFLALPGASASDNCTAQAGLVVTYSDGTLQGSECDGTITRTYTITDACGNAAQVDQVFTVTDDIAPTMSPPAGNQTVECDGSGNTAAWLAWLNGHGGAAATDNCGAVTWSSDYVVGHWVNDCGGAQHVEVTFTATDDCGNASATTATFTIADHTGPTLAGANDLNAGNAEAGTCQKSVMLNVTANDACDHLSYPVTYKAKFGGVWVPVSNPVEFPSGTTQVRATAADACGNITVRTFNVIVHPLNDFVIDVQLQGPLFDPRPGVVGDTITRCIRFGFRDCPSGALVSVNQLVAFSVDNDASNGFSLAGQVLANVPCGVYECVTAEDALHTLQVRIEPPEFTIVGGQYVAHFTGTHLLQQGDLYSDNMIDIADYGVFIGQWGWAGSRSTTCSTPYPHVDMSADGGLDISDFNFISGNFSHLGDNDCCIVPFTEPQPRTSITVAELRRLGVPRAARADLNHDGLIDMTDVQLFLNGVAPADSDYDPIDAEPLPAGDDVGTELTPVKSSASEARRLQ